MSPLLLHPQLRRIVTIVVLAVVGHASAQAAAPKKLPRAVQKEAERIREVLQANFQATNEENLPALMETIGHTMSGRQHFEAEAKKMFEDTDVYLRLEDFQLIEYRPLFAAVRVVQVTLPADEKDREAMSGRRRAYRGGTALLPEWERCVYTQTFHRENGKWKLHLITDRPQAFIR
jgi:sensor domain CHASE-containing protein